MSLLITSSGLWGSLFSLWRGPFLRLQIDHIGVWYGGKRVCCEVDYQHIWIDGRRYTIASGLTKGEHRRLERLLHRHRRGDASEVPVEMDSLRLTFPGSGTGQLEFS